MWNWNFSADPRKPRFFTQFTYYIHSIFNVWNNYIQLLKYLLPVEAIDIT